MAGKTGTLVLAEYSLDRLGVKPVLRLPTAKRGSADHLANSNVPSDLQEKVASLLASESSRKVRPRAIRAIACLLMPSVMRGTSSSLEPDHLDSVLPMAKQSTSAGPAWLVSELERDLPDILRAQEWVM